MIKLPKNGYVEGRDSIDIFKKYFLPHLNKSSASVQDHMENIYLSNNFFWIILDNGRLWFGSFWAEDNRSVTKLYTEKDIKNMDFSHINQNKI